MSFRTPYFTVGICFLLYLVLGTSIAFANPVDEGTTPTVKQNCSRSLCDASPSCTCGETCICITIPETQQEEAPAEAEETRLTEESPEEDTTPFSTRIKGDNPLKLKVGDTFADPGIEVRGGTLLNTLGVRDVDTKTPGNYFITYQIKNNSNNRIETRRRTVKVEKKSTTQDTEDSDTTPPPDEAYIFRNPIKYNNLIDLLFALLNGITLVLMPIIVLAITYIGFRMVWAGREQNADYSKWKNAFAWSLVGLFLVLGARGILYVIRNTVKDVLGPEHATEVDTLLPEPQENT